MKVIINNKGDFSKTIKFLQKAEEFDAIAILEKYGVRGVDALSAATPKDTGETANSWGFEIDHTDGGYTLTWTNSNIQNGYFNVAIMLQYGHGTGTGGYVEGIDYINPALKPIFDAIANDAWKELRGK